MRLPLLVLGLAAIVAVTGLAAGPALAEDCPGSCSGEAMKAGSYSGACGVPCIPNMWILDAQSDARNYAHKVCVEAADPDNPDCQCGGGSYSTVSQSCTTVTDPETHEVTCEWEIRVRYDGSCSLSP